MEGKIAIRSDTVVLENNKIILEGGNLIGDWVKEGEDCEEVCKKKAEEKDIKMKIIKPLHPMIQWGRDRTGSEVVVVSLNYLAHLKGGENAR